MVLVKVVVVVAPQHPLHELLLPPAFGCLLGSHSWHPAGSKVAAATAAAAAAASTSAAPAAAAATAAAAAAAAAR